MENGNGNGGPTKTTSVLYLEAERDVTKQRIFLRSEAIYSVGEKISRGRKSADGSRWNYDTYSYGHVPGLGGNTDPEILRMFSSTLIKEGAWFDIERPMAGDDELKKFVRDIANLADKLVKQYCAAIRIKVSMSIDEPLIRFANVADPTAPPEF